MKPRTLSIGGATYDLFVRTGSDVIHEDREGKILALPLGTKIKVQQVVETCGGGASNTSVGLARLGCTSHFCGVLGSDQWGQRMLENFKKEGVDAGPATIVEGETSSFSIILSVRSGERVILYDPATNAHLHDATFDRENAATMNWLYLNHLHERGCIIEDDLIALLAAHVETKLTWNPGGSQLESGVREAHLRSLLQHTTFFICNKEEACTFTGTTSTDDALNVLVEHGAKNVCICDGARGSFGAAGSDRFHCPIEERTLVDTTGAGDAFGTGATWALLQGLDLPTALRAGTMNAASVIGAIGAQAGLLTDIEMRQKLSL